jgi:hypothetical protein
VSLLSPEYSGRPSLAAAAQAAKHNNIRNINYKIDRKYTQKIIGNNHWKQSLETIIGKMCGPLTLHLSNHQNLLIQDEMGRHGKDIFKQF